MLALTIERDSCATSGGLSTHRSIQFEEMSFSILLAGMPLAERQHLDGRALEDRQDVHRDRRERHAANEQQCQTHGGDGIGISQGSAWISPFMTTQSLGQ